MPYIITTKPSLLHSHIDSPNVSRTAVATLEDARRSAFNAVEAQSVSLRQADYWAMSDAASHLPEAGGTVGPLPDGTVIEVRQVSWGDVVVACGTDDHGRYLIGPDVTNAHVLAAFNAR